MATQAFVEFITLTFKPSAQGDPAQPPSGLSDVLAKLKAVAPAKAIYVGQQIEHPTRWSLFVSWPSAGALADFTSSAEFTPWLASLRALVEHLSSVKAPMRGPSLETALGSPCTEVFTCYGVEDGFIDTRMKPFTDGVEQARPQGFHGSAYGEFEQIEDDQPKGAAVRMLLGWDSKEAHLNQRGEGKVIDSYIHHVRTGRQGVDLFHVNLTKM